MNFFDIQLVRYTGKVIYPAGRTTASTHRLNDSTPQRLNRCGHNGGCGGCGTSSSRWSLSGGMAKRWSMVAAPGCCRLSARLDVRRGLNAARPSRAMHSLGLSMSRKRAPCVPKAGPCFDSTTRQDVLGESRDECMAAVGQARRVRGPELMQHPSHSRAARQRNPAPIGTHQGIVFAVPTCL